MTRDLHKIILLGQLARLIPLNYQERLLRVMERFPIGTLHPSILRE